jgi:hypothetical protein
MVHLCFTQTTMVQELGGFTCEETSPEINDALPKTLLETVLYGLYIHCHAYVY